MTIKVSATCDFCTSTEVVERSSVTGLQLPLHWFKIQETKIRDGYVGPMEYTRHFCGLGCVASFYVNWDQREAAREAEGD